MIPLDKQFYKQILEIDIVEREQRLEGNCGICGEDGLEVSFQNNISHGAHKKCYTAIEKCVTELNELVKTLFLNIQSKGARNSHQQKAGDYGVCCVQNACSPETIQTYCKKNGENALTKLFHTIGVVAAKEYEYNVNNDRKDGLVARDKLQPGQWVQFVSLEKNIVLPIHVSGYFKVLDRSDDKSSCDIGRCHIMDEEGKVFDYWPKMNTIDDRTSKNQILMPLFKAKLFTNDEMKCKNWEKYVKVQLQAPKALKKLARSTKFQKGYDPDNESQMMSGAELRNKYKLELEYNLEEF